MKNSIIYISADYNKDRTFIEFLSGFFVVRECSEETASIMYEMEAIRPRLVIMNIHGFSLKQKQFIQELKDNPKYDAIPMIAYGSKEDYYAIGMYVYSPFNVNLYAPIDKEVLLLSVCNQLNLEMPPLQGDSYQIGELSDRKRKVLLVDDDAMMLRTIKGMLDDKYKILLATSGMGALTTIGRERPDVILLDYVMPVCDGKMTLEMIRAEEELRDIPVFFMTGVADREKIKAVLRLNPKGYMLKPPNREKIRAQLEELFQEL